jgi:hypothetical protein
VEDRRRWSGTKGKAPRALKGLQPAPVRRMTT